jgi:hypothetical protein
MKQRNKEKREIDNKRNQQGEVVDKQTGNKMNKHRKKNSKVTNNRISVLVPLVLVLQHPVLVLVFK